MALSRFSEELADLVKRVSKYVVTVYTVRPDVSILRGVTVRGVGSGFVSEGYIVTNAHVLEGSPSAIIVYSDGRKGKARVVASDPYRDLALLEHQGLGLEGLKLGDSDRLMVGELVLAIGSPLGMPGPSVSLGVVSAVGRIITGPHGEILEDMIQTDAAINPGNSGGPLVNLRGEVVGVATAIVPYAQGIGFAIPSNTVKRFLSIVRRYGRPLRAWIGVYVAPITPLTASALNLPVDEGVVVVRVVPGSPAEAHGIAEGDLIIEAGGRRVKRPKDLRDAVEDSIGRECVNLKILRGLRVITKCVPLVIEG